jgi:hypothetical protein
MLNWKHITAPMPVEQSAILLVAFDDEDGQYYVMGRATNEIDGEWRYDDNEQRRVSFEANFFWIREDELIDDLRVWRLAHKR